MYFWTVKLFYEIHNAKNHAAFAENALLANKMIWVWVENEFYDAMQQTKPVVFSNNYLIILLQGIPKRLK